MRGTWMALAVTATLVGASGAASAQAVDAKAVYKKLCASCHGPDGRGNPAKAKILKIDPKLLDLGRPESANLTRDQLKTILLKGKNKMPAYEKKLKPAEVDPVLDFAIELAKAIRGGKAVRPSGAR
jgi:mono/diheme cytochrome c family protein